MTTNKKNGFEKLRGLAATGALAGLAMVGILPPGTARAGSFSSSYTFSSTKASVKNSWIWRATCYQSILSDESLTTSKGLSLNASGSATGMAIVDGYLNTDVNGTIKEWPDAFGEQRTPGGGSAGVLGLAVNGSAPDSCMSSIDLDTSDPDYQSFTESITDIVTGVDLTRQFTYLTFRPVVRGFFSFTNTTDGDIDVIAHIINSLSSSSNTVVETSSDENTTHDAADAWVITSGDNNNDDALPAVTSWTGISNELVAKYGDGSKVNKGSMVTRYELTVPAGESVSLVAFIELSPNASIAEASMSSYNGSDAMETAGLLDGLSENEIASIVNIGEAVIDEAVIDEPIKKKKSDGFLGTVPVEILLGLGGLLALRRIRR